MSAFMKGLLLLTCFHWCRTLSEDLTAIPVLNRNVVQSNRFKYIGQISNVGTEGRIYETCSCSLLDSNWVLTAAHCFSTEKDPVRRKVEIQTLEKNQACVVKAGTEKGFSHEDEDNLLLQIRVIAKIVLHPEYNLNFQNNVALAKTARPFTENSGISYVILATPPAILLSSFNWTLLTLGFGDFEKNEDVLQSALIDMDQTQDELQSITYKLGDNYVSYVDAGGPAVYSDGIQFGITSFVRKQEGGTFVIVYERVDRHIKFIKKLCPKAALWKPERRVVSSSSKNVALTILTVNVTIATLIGSLLNIN